MGDGEEGAGEGVGSEGQVGVEEVGTAVGVFGADVGHLLAGQAALLELGVVEEGFQLVPEAGVDVA